MGTPVTNLFEKIVESKWGAVTDCNKHNIIPCPRARDDRSLN
jgi:hypothetical protein